jgi:hypothetical protein
MLTTQNSIVQGHECSKSANRGENRNLYEQMNKRAYKIHSLEKPAPTLKEYSFLSREGQYRTSVRIVRVKSHHHPCPFSIRPRQPISRLDSHLSQLDEVGSLHLGNIPGRGAIEPSREVSVVC